MKDDNSTMDLAAETDDKASTCFVAGVTVGITPGLTTTATPCKDVSTELTCDFIGE
jgi:hypothetical protein